MEFLFIFITAVVVVGIFMLGMSLTQLLKGHPIQSEISENSDMKERGIKCAKEQILDEERALGTLRTAPDACSHECSSCMEHLCK